MPVLTRAAKVAANHGQAAPKNTPKKAKAKTKAGPAKGRVQKKKKKTSGKKPSPSPTPDKDVDNGGPAPHDTDGQNDINTENDGDNGGPAPHDTDGQNDADPEDDNDNGAPAPHDTDGRDDADPENDADKESDADRPDGPNDADKEDDPSEQPNGSTSPSRPSSADSGTILYRNASTQTPFRRRRTGATRPIIVQAQRRAGWLRQGLGAVLSGVLLNAAFFQFNHNDSAEEFCVRQLQRYQRITNVTEEDRCRPHYCPDTFAWHEIPHFQKRYQPLGLHPNATDEDIKSACRRVQKRWHPNHTIGQGLEKDEADKIILTINEACEVLQDEEARRLYDESKREGEVNFLPMVVTDGLEPGK